MGGRGSFVNVSAGDFHFLLGGQEYISLATIDNNIKIIVKVGGNTKSVPAPLYSHTAGRIYATVKDGKLKYISFYDENHVQYKTIDFSHSHGGVVPHVHFDLNHDPKLPGVPPSSDDWGVINSVLIEMKKLGLNGSIEISNNGKR